MAKFSPEQLAAAYLEKYSGSMPLPLSQVVSFFKNPSPANSMAAKMTAILEAEQEASHQHALAHPEEPLFELDPPAPPVVTDQGWCTFCTAPPVVTDQGWCTFCKGGPSHPALPVAGSYVIYDELTVGAAATTVSWSMNTGAASTWSTGTGAELCPPSMSVLHPKVMFLGKGGPSAGSR